MNTWMIIFVLILMIMLGLCAFAPFFVSSQYSRREEAEDNYKQSIQPACE